MHQSYTLPRKFCEQIQLVCILACVAHSNLTATASRVVHLNVRCDRFGAALHSEAKKHLARHSQQA